MKTQFVTLTTFILLSLSACGGNSSSGGPVIITINDGVYSGFETEIISRSSGEVITSRTYDFTLSIFENVVTIFNPVFSAQAEIFGASFTVNSGEFVQRGDEVTCRITIIYSGVVNNGLALGTLSGNYICGLTSGEGIEITYPVSGSFEATRGASAAKEGANDFDIDFEVLSDHVKSMQ